MQFWEGSIGTFLVLSIVLGGGAAYVTGGAVASNWRPLWLALFYCALIAGAVRFLSFALAGGRLLAVDYYLVELVLDGLLATLGYYVARAGQMARQYGWLYGRRGPLGWGRRGVGGG